MSSNSLNAYEQKLKDGTKSLRLGEEVPEGDVDLAYVHSKALDPDENISLINTTNTPENLIPFEQQESIVIPDQNGQLHYASIVSDYEPIIPQAPYEAFPSDKGILTRKFLKDQHTIDNALYYVFEIKYHYDSQAGTPLKVVPYTGQQIEITDENGNPLDDRFKYEIEVMALEENPHIYMVRVYMHQNTNEEATFKIRYNHIDKVTADNNIQGVQQAVTLYSNSDNTILVNGIEKQMLESGKLRIINGESACKQVTKQELEQYTPNDDVFAVEENPAHNGYDYFVTQRSEADPRPHRMFNYKVIARYYNKEHGVEQKVTVGYIHDWVINPEALLEYEKLNYTNEWKRLGIPKEHGQYNAKEMIELALPYTTPSVPEDAIYEIVDAQGNLLYSSVNAPDNPDVETQISSLRGDIAEAKAINMKAQPWLNAMHPNIRLVTQPIRHQASVIAERQKTKWTFEWKATGQGEIHTPTVFTTNFWITANVTIHTSSGDVTKDISSLKYPVTLDHHQQVRIMDDEVDTFMKPIIDDYVKDNYPGSTYTVNNYKPYTEDPALKLTIDEIDDGHLWGQTNSPLAGGIQIEPWSTSDHNLDVYGGGYVVYHEDGEFTIYVGPSKLPTYLIPDEVVNFHWNTPVVTNGDHISLSLDKDGETIIATASIPDIVQLNRWVVLPESQIIKEEGIKIIEDNIFASGGLYDQLNIDPSIPKDEIMLRLERGKATSPFSAENPEYRVNYRFQCNNNGLIRYPVDQFQDQLGINRLRLSNVYLNYEPVIFDINYEVLVPKTITTDMKDLFAKGADGAVMIEQSPGTADWTIQDGVLTDPTNSQQFVGAYNKNLTNNTYHQTDFAFKPIGGDDDIIGILFRVKDAKNFYMLVIEGDDIKTSDSNTRVDNAQPDDLFSWNIVKRTDVASDLQFSKFTGWGLYHQRVYKVVNGKKTLVKQRSTISNKGYINDWQNNVRIISKGNTTDIYFQTGLPTEDGWEKIYSVDTSWDYGFYGICNFSKTVEFLNISTIHYDKVSGTIKNLSITGHPGTEVAANVRAYCDTAIKNHLAELGYDISHGYIPYHFSVTQNNKKGKVFIAENGNGPLVVFSEVKTDETPIPTNIVAWTHYEELEATPVYAILFEENKKIDIEKPKVPFNKANEEGWFIRIKKGKFQKPLELPYYEPEEKVPALYEAYTELNALRPSSPDEKKYVYLEYDVPEYQNQPFYHQPIILIAREQPIIINDFTIQTTHRPIVLHSEKGLSYLEVESIRQGQPRLLRIADVDAQKGFIYLLDRIQEQDDVLVRYAYAEDYLTYRGFYKDNHFFKLDLNPTPGHFYTLSQATVLRKIPMDKESGYGEIIQAPTNELLVKDIHLYLRPVRIRDESGNIIVNTQLNQVVYHTDNEHPFDPNSSEYDPTLFRVGKINVQGPKIQDMVVLDTRTRGGGLDEALSKEIIAQVNKESLYHWDIGYFDGEVYQENGVIIIRLPNTLLNRFTEAEIQAAVQKHKAYGVMPIIEFYDPKQLTKQEYNLLANPNFHEGQHLSYHSPALDSGSYAIQPETENSSNYVLTLKDNAQYGIMIPGDMFKEGKEYRIEVKAKKDTNATNRPAGTITIEYTNGTQKAQQLPPILSTEWTTLALNFKLEQQAAKVTIWLNDKTTSVKGNMVVDSLMILPTTTFDNPNEVEIHEI